MEKPLEGNREARKTELNDALIRINALINSTLVIDEIMQRIVGDAAHIIGCDSSFIVLHEDGHWRIKFSYNLPHESKERSYSDDELPQMVLASNTKAPVAISDSFADDRVNPEIMKQIGIKSSLAIPLMVRDEVIGGLSLNYQAKAVRFRDPEIDFAGEIASSISLALGNAALYEQLRRSEAELREGKKLRESLDEIHLLIHSTLDMDRIINGVIAKGTEAIEAESAMVFFQNEVDMWEVKYVYQLPAELIGRKYESEMVRHSVIAIEKNRPVAIDDVQSDDRVDRRFVDSLNIKSLLDFPLITKEKILGDVVFHYHSKATSFSDAHVDFAGKLASSLTLALENSVLFRQVKYSAEALRESEKWLKLTIDELNRSNNELQQFVSIVSHDLQEPLRTVANFLELLAARYKGKLDEKAETYIAFAVDGAQRMSRLIYDLVAYSRVGTRVGEFGLVAFEEILKQVKDSFHRAIEESGTEISHDRLPEVEGDSTQLGQVLQNLLGNAIKFRKKEVPPRIHISAERMGNEWLFGVHDNGIGIDSRYRDRIFIIFQRLHSREEFAGTGVGLAICKKIVERHHGRIWVESTLGKGSSFYFTLPARQVKG